MKNYPNTYELSTEELCEELYNIGKEHEKQFIDMNYAPNSAVDATRKNEIIKTILHRLNRTLLA